MAAESPQHQAGHEQVHVLPNNPVPECGEGPMSIPAPPAQGDSAVPGGEGRLMGGGIKAGTERNKEWEKNSLCPPHEDVLPEMKDSGSNREC